MKIFWTIRHRTFFLAIFKVAAVLFWALSMIVYPQTIFHAALRGLETWWKIAFPALLPFFVVSELLMGLGLVHFLGVLLEPIMRPLFNVPGSGAFVVAVGYTSGAPIGASLTAQLRKQNLCTKTEAERLMAFTNNASPLFMFGAIAVGMLHNPNLGIYIAGAHYLANLCVGLALRFYGSDQPHLTPGQPKQEKIFYQAAKAMLKAQAQDGRPLGKLLGDAIKNSMQALLTIGGFIIIFSVIIEVLTLIPIIDGIAAVLSLLIPFKELDQELIYALSSGFFEMTIGAKLTSETNAPLDQQLLVISMILGWLGISVHAQAYSMISETDIDFKPYLLARVGHSFLAAIWTWLFLKFNVNFHVSAAKIFTTPLTPWILSFYFMKLSFLIILVLLVLSMLFLLGKNIKKLTS